MAPTNTSLHAKLCLLQCISKYTGPKDIDGKRHEQSLKALELRRAFTNQISYLCDGWKDGTTVTGSFLQSLENGNVLWVASNEGVGAKVLEFLNWAVLEVLRAVTDKSRANGEIELLNRAVALASDRLEFYRYQMCRFGEECLKYLIQCQGGDANG